MKYIFFLLFFFNLITSFSQTINLNESHIIDNLRTSQLLGKLKTDISFTLRPIDINKNLSNVNSTFNKEEYSPVILNFLNGNGIIKLLPIDSNFEFNSHHPYNRNNGSMIPNRGYQHVLSTGFYAEIGPLSIQFKPEHHFSENKKFDGFWEGHYPIIWRDRYRLWNHIDLPERFGEISHNRFLIGQSSIRLNYKKISLGLSNENIWWGPSIRNSIAMSNHAEGFKHLTFNSRSPIQTFLGNFEWQIITGRLESSGYLPPRANFEYAGTKLYKPRWNQLGRTDDWRYLQGYLITYSPKWIDGLSIGFTRWVQMYSALVEGKYFWMNGNPSWFPIFANFFRKNDNNVDLEEQTNQAAGVFFRWYWKDSRAEIYMEYHFNDAKQNLRDLLLDTDHSRAVTLGMQKIFKINNSDFLFSWEWTQMEQSSSRLVRNAGSWYEHNYVYDGFTNRGEVLGSGIGPGSNSQYFSINRVRENEKIGVSFEIIDHDNDFFHEAFASAGDFRRYWKDYNLHLNYDKKFKKFWISSNLIYSRGLNYQWELEDYGNEYYRPGRDVNNFHASIKLTYFIPLTY